MEDDWELTLDCEWYWWPFERWEEFSWGEAGVETDVELLAECRCERGSDD